MHKLTRRVPIATLIAVVAVCGVALAAKPKPLGSYGDQHTSLQADTKGKTLTSFDGVCTPVTNPKYTFTYDWGIPVKSSGKFHASHKNSVNTPAGQTLGIQTLVTIKGKFVSRTEAKGSYLLHKSGCKKIKFDVKLGQ
ncbi:MAG TPA: hypothetical protein VJU60_07370 [Thermoleophilaceae bacterium]|nr:hypothetical protein [Thermoleophilaceae bacterium]